MWDDCDVMPVRTTADQTLQVVGAAIIDHLGRCLVALRGPEMSSPGRWEFPGGKVEHGEKPEDALRREIEEELGLRIEVGDHIGRGRAEGTRHHVVLDVYRATVVGGELRLHEHADARWLHADELDSVPWADADRPVLPRLRAQLQARGLDGDSTD